MLKGINSGSLDTRITFEVYTPTVNVIGNKPAQTGTYGSPFTVWGSLKPTSGTENFETNQQVANRACEVVIRYRVGMSENMRFTDTRLSDLYYVKSIENNPREGYCRIMGEKRDNQ